jgi:hypothetical protein
MLDAPCEVIGSLDSLSVTNYKSPGTMQQVEDVALVVDPSSVREVFLAGSAKKFALCRRPLLRA